jgi:hypothetical protein
MLHVQKNKDREREHSKGMNINAIDSSWRCCCYIERKKRDVREEVVERTAIN